jgi:hypothetical protein
MIVTQIEAKKEPPTTALERRWVSVAWGNGVNMDGGFWVLEYEIMMYGWQERYNHVPFDVGKISLAMSMNEKCQILKGMGGKFYDRLEQYEGVACLNMWDIKAQSKYVGSPS